MLIISLFPGWRNVNLTLWSQEKVFISISQRGCYCPCSIAQNFVNSIFKVYSPPPEYVDKNVQKHNLTNNYQNLIQEIDYITSVLDSSNRNVRTINKTNKEKQFYINYLYQCKKKV